MHIVSYSHGQRDKLVAEGFDDITKNPVHLGVILSLTPSLIA
jgi:hypothetical protein